MSLKLNAGFHYGIRENGTAWISIGDPMRPPHAACDVNLPEWALAEMWKRFNVGQLESEKKDLPLPLLPAAQVEPKPADILEDL